jgi:hypothetical protein
MLAIGAPWARRVPSFVFPWDLPTKASQIDLFPDLEIIASAIHEE